MKTVCFQQLDQSKPVYGARDEFLKLGAEGFMQKILKEDKLYVTDTTMRDAQQSLMATRMRSKDLVRCCLCYQRIHAECFFCRSMGRCYL